MASFLHAILVLSLLNYAFAAPLPVVMMHGIAATASDLDHVAALLRSAFPGIYVRSMEIGGSNAFLGSIFTDVAVQVDDFCASVKSDPNLQNTQINLIGFSQGGIIARGFIEKCVGGPPVNTFISWVSPQAGTFGVPSLGGKKGVPKDIDKYISHLVECCIYAPLGQDSLAFAGYWKDPQDYSGYLAGSVLLADINNERTAKNPSYKNRITGLKQMALSYSTIDNILQPKESGWWSFYAIGSNGSQVIPVQQTPFYTQDWLGLRTLSESGRLTFFSTTCDHGDYDSPCFDKYFNTYALPLLQKSQDL